MGRAVPRAFVVRGRCSPKFSFSGEAPATVRRRVMPLQSARRQLIACRLGCGSGTGIRTPVPWLRNGTRSSGVLGIVGFVREIVRIVGPSPPETALFVRKVSSFFQVFSRHAERRPAFRKFQQQPKRAIDGTTRQTRSQQPAGSRGNVPTEVVRGTTAGVK
jgi:hypothetical protein